MTTRPFAERCPDMPAALCFFPINSPVEKRKLEVISRKLYRKKGKYNVGIYAANRELVYQDGQIEKRRGSKVV